MKGGTLFGLGIGPGDPELITLKAERILRSVPVVAYPAPENGDSLARAIAAPHLIDDQTEIAIRTPMTPGRFPADEVYDRYAVEISGHLDERRDVAVLCEGDPFLYGSFMYLFAKLSGSHKVEVVPGVSSLGACAAVAGQALVSRNQVLTVVPATLPEAELEKRLAEADAAAVMKVGRHLKKVKRVIGRLGLGEGARYVERATMADEKIAALCDVKDGMAPYFSMILVRCPDDARKELKKEVEEKGRNVTARRGLPEGVALVVLGPGGLGLAATLKPLLPGSDVHGLEGRAEGKETDVVFVDTASHLRDLFAQSRPIVGICAAPILIRALASVLADKRRDPPVVAVTDDGSTAVPLLGGHRGANRLARAIAEATGGQAAVTTAGDVRLGLALDDPPPGWRAANPEAVKAITAALLAGKPVKLTVEAGDTEWITDSDAIFVDDSPVSVRVTDKAVADPGKDLVLHPPVLVLGVGCERGTDEAELIGLAAETLEGAGLAAGAVACVASLDLKADEAAVLALADHLNVSAQFFPAEALEAEAPRLSNPSEVVYRAVGCHGVAEGAALAAVGRDGELAVEKKTSIRATCAVGRAARSIDPAKTGRARGKLTVVGIGPGQAEWRTPEATKALREASDVVGYRLYLDLVEDLIAGKALHSSDLGAEEDRVRLALDLAARGKQVALVSSGDAGIYALAALVFELLDCEDRANWNRLAVSVAPGISALQAAAARIGAPLGHDFCAISLSDLLTPWKDIEKRLVAAAAGDFVVALYNPISKRRQKQLTLARDLLLTARPPETPVVLARNLGRDGETVEIVSLEDLTPGLVDMLTVVLVGNSRTRLIERGPSRWVYTPRGYGDRAQATARRAP